MVWGPKYGLGVSDAQIRNELLAYTQLGQRLLKVDKNSPFIKEVQDLLVQAKTSVEARSLLSAFVPKTRPSTPKEQEIYDLMRVVLKP